MHWSYALLIRSRDSARRIHTQCTIRARTHTHTKISFVILFYQILDSLFYFIIESREFDRYDFCPYNVSQVHAHDCTQITMFPCVGVGGRYASMVQFNTLILTVGCIQTLLYCATFRIHEFSIWNLIQRWLKKNQNQIIAKDHPFENSIRTTREIIVQTFLPSEFNNGFFYFLATGTAQRISG